MAKKLVIVESPAKVKTIKKYLGSSYDVVASKGHVRDLPKSTMGIDIENDYEPKYITIRGKGDLVADLKKLSKEADRVYLATDPDREGEAISWHLAIALGLQEKDVCRITFNEITRNAVKNSIKHPRGIDMDLVDAQQARRILDRLVGYTISPILWKKVKRGLSAGRVQSAALKIICDRDREINDFVPEEYWTLEAVLSAGGKKTFTARFSGVDGSKPDTLTAEEIRKIMADLEGCSYTVESVKHSVHMRKSPLPFTTSTLQQEASKQLNFSISKTMSVAQQLYERGLITYLRTDSIRISDEAVAAAKGFIAANYGKEYVSFVTAKARGNSKAQDAHEAIRPTDINAVPESLKESLDKDSFRLYQLIWKRFVASRMTNAKYDVTSVDFESAGYIFKASASKRTFDGFMKVYTSADEEKEEKNNLVSSISGDSEITGVEYEGTQHFTQPPAHYTEATLVRALEEQGIGRPSTYSPTISVILARHYVKKEKKNIVATELGTVVNEIMTEAFPSVVDIKFTANIEELLDQVEEGKKNWKDIIRDFYPDLKQSIDQARSKLEKIRVKDEETDIICEKCGRNMVIKFGPHGKFLACPGFPECRNTKPYYEKTGVKCPRCDGEIVVKKSKKGRRYFGCTNVPDCDFMSWQKPSDVKCEKCGSTHLHQDEDTLDTWFSSALWPFSTLGWPEQTEDLKTFYPTNTIVTGYEIISLWIARMIFSGLEYVGAKPFSDIIIHGMVRDDQGRKMSKTLGNGVDPLDVIAEYGADALRFSLTLGITFGNDIRYIPAKVEQGSNFANKLWNASKFVLMNLEDYDEKYDLSKLCKEDKWILSKVNRLAEEMARNIDNYDLGVATQKIYDFIWNEFCDWYIEIVKPRLYDKECSARREAQFTLNTVLEYSLKMLHPIMPFVTEEIYTKLYNNDETIVTSAWPKFKEEFDFEVEEQEIELLKTIITDVRNVRNNMNVHPAKKSKLIFVTEKYADLIKQSTAFLQKLAFGDEIIIQANKENIPANAISIMNQDIELYIPFEDLVDIAAEKERLENEKVKLEAEVERAKKMLSNPGFVNKAPEAKINEEKEKLAKYEEMLKNTIERLSNM